MRRNFLALSAAVACLIPPLAQAEAPTKEEPTPAQGESKIFGPASPSLEERQKKRKDIRKLFTVMKKEEFANKVFARLIESVQISMPDVPEEFWTRFREELKPSKFVRLLVPIFDRQFDHDGILELIAFYESPIGQKVIQVDPVITEQSMKLGQALGKRTTKKVLRDMKRAQRGAKSR